MNDLDICAIAYKLDMKDLTDGTFTITFTWAIESIDGVSISPPRRWKLRLPDPIEFVDRPFGTSAVRGILGGVAQPWLFAQSEAVERCLGDACTVALAEIIDSGQFQPSIVMLLGPAFPKVLGRFVSLRPPTDIPICWVTPLNTLPLMEQLWRQLLPLQAGAGPAMSWSNETLLNHFRYEQSQTSKFWVQYLDYGDDEKTVEMIQHVLEKRTIKRSFLEAKSNQNEISSDAELPRQLRLAIDVVQLGPRENTVSYKGLNFLNAEDASRMTYLGQAVNKNIPKYPFKNEAIA